MTVTATKIGVIRHSFHFKYTLLGTELSTETINTLLLPGKSMLVTGVLFHEALGDVTLKLGVAGDVDGFIQSQLANDVGTAMIGQGISAGIGQAPVASRLILVTMVLNSGAYTAGKVVEFWGTYLRRSN